MAAILPTKKETVALESGDDFSGSEGAQFAIVYGHTALDSHKHTRLGEYFYLLFRCFRNGYTIFG